MSTTSSEGENKELVPYAVESVPPLPPTEVPTPSKADTKYYAHFADTLQDHLDALSFSRVYHVVQGYRCGVVPRGYVHPWTAHLVLPFKALSATWERICSEGRVAECGFTDTGSVAAGGSLSGTLMTRRVTPSYRHITKSHKRHMLEIVADIREGDVDPPRPLDPCLNTQYVLNPRTGGDAFLEPSQRWTPREIIVNALEDAAADAHTAWESMTYMDDGDDHERESRRLQKTGARLREVSDRLRMECVASHRVDEIAAVKARDKRYDASVVLLLDAMELSGPCLSCLCAVRCPSDVGGFMAWVEAGPFTAFLMSLFVPADSFDTTALRRVAAEWVRAECHEGFLIPWTFLSHHARPTRSLMLYSEGVLLFQQLAKCMEKYVAAERCARRRDETRTVLEVLETAPEPTLATALDMRNVFLTRQARMGAGGMDAVLAGLQLGCGGGDGIAHYRNALSGVNREVYTVRCLDTDLATGSSTLRIAMDVAVRFPEDFPLQLPPYTAEGPWPEVPAPSEWDRFGDELEGGSPEKAGSDADE